MAAAARAAVGAGAVVGADRPVAITQLDSGIRVVTERVPGARSVCTGVWVGVGARDEPAELAGVSHFLEHLVFKGSATRSAREIAEAVDRVGGDMNAFTTKEYTAYYTRLPVGQLDLSVDLLADVLTAPALRDADIEAERQVILEELHMDADTPDDRVHTLLFEALFPDHPLGRETAGDLDTVAAIAPADIRAFFEANYQPGAFVVAAAGAVDHHEVVAAVSARFESRGAAPDLDRRPPARPVRPLQVLRRPTEQVHLAMGFHAFGRDDPDREALDVLNHVLGGGMSSRLFQNIREERGLAYSVFSSPVAYADAGALTVYAGTTPARVDEVLDLIDAELQHLIVAGITDDELKVALGYLEGSFLLGLEDATSRMSRLGGSLTCLGGIRPVREQLARYRSVTHDDVARVVARLLTGVRSLAVVGPVTRKRLLARAS